LCRVSHTLVGQIRRQHLETAFTDAGQQQPVNTVAPDRRRTVQRGGKRYEMNTSGIGKTTAGAGKKAPPAPMLDSRAWSISTPQAREAFVREIGAREIQATINDVEPDALRRFESIKQAWDAATFPERLAFAREHHDEIKTLGWQQKYQ
jgi:hypothetical protein